MSILTAKWGSDKISVSADWQQSACQVEGSPVGQNVAYHKNSKTAALYAAVEAEAKAEGMDTDDEGTIAAITYAVEHAVETWAITLFRDKVWSTQGVVRDDGHGPVLDDCPGDLGDDVWTAIETAIENGDDGSDGVIVGEHKYTWVLK